MPPTHRGNKQFDTDTPEHLFKLTTRYHFQGPLEKRQVQFLEKNRQQGA
jgi:outer membrane receptor for ferric coprogen and ferric-rhodotorulic acid